MLLAASAFHAAVFLFFAAVDATVGLAGGARWLSDVELPLTILSSIEFQFLNRGLTSVVLPLQLHRIHKLYSFLAAWHRRHLLSGLGKSGLAELYYLLLAAQVINDWSSLRLLYRQG